MVERSLRKGKSTYQYKVGDLVLLLENVNEKTKKVMRKKKKLEDKYLKDLAEIVEVQPNRRYVLKMRNGDNPPHGKKVYTCNQFELWEESTAGHVQQITEREVI
jgi:hypothetical protein